VKLKKKNLVVAQITVDQKKNCEIHKGCLCCSQIS